MVSLTIIIQSYNVATFTEGLLLSKYSETSVWLWSPCKAASGLLLQPHSSQVPNDIIPYIYISIILIQSWPIGDHCVVWGCTASPAFLIIHPEGGVPWDFPPQAKLWLLNIHTWCYFPTQQHQLPCLAVSRTNSVQNTESDRLLLVKE